MIDEMPSDYITRHLFDWRIKYGSLSLIKLPLYSSNADVSDSYGWAVFRRLRYEEYLIATDMIERGWWESVNSYIEDECLIYPDLIDVELPIGICIAIVDDSGFKDVNNVAKEILDNPNNISNGQAIGIQAKAFEISVEQLNKLTGDEYIGYLAKVSADKNLIPGMLDSDIEQQYMAQSEQMAYTQPIQSPQLSGGDMHSWLLASARERGIHLYNQLKYYRDLEKKGVRPKVPKINIQQDRDTLQSVWAGR